MCSTGFAVSVSQVISARLIFTSLKYSQGGVSGGGDTPGALPKVRPNSTRRYRRCCSRFTS